MGNTALSGGSNIAMIADHDKQRRLQQGGAFLRAHLYPAMLAIELRES